MLRRGCAVDAPWMRRVATTDVPCRNMDALQTNLDEAGGK